MSKTPISDRERASKKKRRVLYVHNSGDLYGASRSLLRLLGVLDRERFEPFVLLPQKGPLLERMEELNVRVFFEPSLAIISRYDSLAKVILWRLPISVFRILRVIRRHQIDLIHSNSGVIISPAVSAKLSRIPHIWHVRESFEEFSGWRWKFYSAFMKKFAARIVCVSDAMARQFADQANVTVIHNGFSLAEFTVDHAALRKDFRARLDIDSSAIAAGCVGRIKLKRKGQEYLIQAGHLLKSRGVMARYLIVGSPYAGNESHLNELKKQACELDLEKETTFLGELTDPKPAYAAMDIFVLPSAQPEPFGGVVMEAMAMGLPVIATNIGGSLDQVVDGATGFLIPPADVEALADKIQLLAGDAELREQFGAAGRERIATTFNLQIMVRKIESVYDSSFA